MTIHLQQLISTHFTWFWLAYINSGRLKFATQNTRNTNHKKKSNPLNVLLLCTFYIFKKLLIMKKNCFTPHFIHFQTAHVTILYDLHLKKIFNAVSNRGSSSIHTSPTKLTTLCQHFSLRRPFTDRNLAPNVSPCQMKISTQNTWDTNHKKNRITTSNKTINLIHRPMPFHIQLNHYFYITRWSILSYSFNFSSPHLIKLSIHSLLTFLHTIQFCSLS